MPSGKPHLVPLGGLGEFGMNCMAVRWGDDIIVVDAGMMFPEAELLGVDIVVPDISYLMENRQRVRAIVLTHGHEDHIGALPWVLSELNVPVWGTEFTLAYVEDKLDEHQLLDDADLREIRPGQSFKIGPFTVHPIQVTHSLVDCVSLAIHTPLGVVIHTGDFKVDPTPTDNRLFDLHAFAEYGTEGEPMSALSRAAVDNHKHAKIEKGDTVMLSSRIIPGNEKAIYRMVDHLFRREAHVIYDDGSTPPVHVSGHASQEELKLIINLVKPKYFIPIHGEYRQLKLHAELAASMHGSVGNVMLIESGDVLEFDELGARKAGRVNVGRICIDSGSRAAVVEDLVIQHRRHLSEDC